MTDIIWALCCHMVGDYVLQSDFIARSKGENWYHLFVHCVLYCVPFLVVFGLTWHIGLIFVSHFIIDSWKARWKMITYAWDQVFHYIVLAFCLYL